MKFPMPLIPATFVKRYKRFFVDAMLEDGARITAHTPNTGSMKGLLKEGARCWLTHNPDPKRKLHYTLEMIEAGGSTVGVHTGHPNKLVKEGIETGSITELQGYSTITPEQKYGENSRIDLLLTAESRPACYVEVKNVTLAEGETALFPDAVTTRGTKHLKELMAMVAHGHRAVMVYLIQRMDCTTFSPAAEIDPTYTATLKEAAAHGVELLAYDCTLTQREINIRQPVKIVL